MLKFGSKVVYPYQGPCLIGAVVTGETKSAAEEQVDQALNVQKNMKRLAGKKEVRWT